MPLENGLNVCLQLAVALYIWVVQVDESNELGQSVLRTTLLGDSSCLHFTKLDCIFLVNFFVGKYDGVIF